MSTAAMESHDIDRLERDIAVTRESLHTKLHALEERLSPAAQMRRVRQQLNPEPYVAWAALGAVATGAYLAVRGWRRHRGDAGDWECEDGFLFLDAAEPDDAAGEGVL